MVEGQAERITDRPTLERLAAVWATKWDQWQFRVTDAGFTHPGAVRSPSKPDACHLALVFAVQPTKILAFAKGNFSHTRYLPTSPQLGSRSTDCGLRS